MPKKVKQFRNQTVFDEAILPILTNFSIIAPRTSKTKLIDKPNANQLPTRNAKLVMSYLMTYTKVGQCTMYVSFGAGVTIEYYGKQ